MPYRTESFGRWRIAQTVLPDESVPFDLKVSKLPVEENQFITIDPDSPNEEIFFYTTITWTPGEAWIITVTGRGYNVNDDVQDISNQREHEENAEFKLALNHIIINNKADLDFAHFTGELRVPVFADEAARDAAIPSPTDGLIAYLNNIEDFTSFKGWFWINGLWGWSSATYYQDSTTDGSLGWVVDGLNTVFTTSNQPASASAVTVTYNWIVQEEGWTEDYTIAGQTITFNTAPVAWKIVVIYPDSPVWGWEARTRNIADVDANNGELYRSLDDSNNLTYKDDTWDIYKIYDEATGKLNVPSATELIEWISFKANNAEVIAWVEDTKFVTSKWIKDNYVDNFISSDSISISQSSSHIFTVPANCNIIIAYCGSANNYRGDHFLTKNWRTSVPTVWVGWWIGNWSLNWNTWTNQLTWSSDSSSSTYPCTLYYYVTL